MTEAPGVANYGFVTNYAYDALGNLRRVDQDGQHRFFMYDSLGRLIRARNPEQAVNASLNTGADPVSGNYQWSMGYSYDAGGNLYQRTDARNVTTTYAYDALNRNTLVDYSNTASNPDIDRHYDNPTAGSYGRGRYYYDYFNKDDGTVDHQAIDAYDVMGRPRTRRQVFYSGGQWHHYPVTRAYDLVGNVTSETYPSGHTVSYAYDAAGRLGDNGASPAFKGNLGDGTQRTYSAGVSYDEASRMREERFGTATPLYHKLHYNVRGQLFDVRLSSVAWGSPNGEWDWNRSALLNYYSQAEINSPTNEGHGLSGVENNGNLKRASVYVPTDPNASYSDAGAGAYYVAHDDYLYDPLNRLTSVSETNNVGASTVSQAYTYDRFGNRQIDAGATSAGVNARQFTIDISTNRLTNAGMLYDAAGNLTQDTYSAQAAQRTYDAESRMTMEQSSATSVFSRYAYDADGHRARRDVGGSVTWQVYGFGGELIAEYAGGAAPTSPQKEYGYRAGELLITAEPGGGTSQGAQAVTWQNAVGVTASQGSLTKTASSGWNTGGASSVQSIQSGDGYVEFTAALSTDDVMCGLSHGDTNQDYTDIDFAIYASHYNNAVLVLESGVNKGTFGTFSAGDRFRVAVEGGVVKYYRVTNGTPTLFYTSAATPSYPLLADTTLFWTGDQMTNVVMSAGGGGSWQLPAFVTSFYTSVLNRQPTTAELSAQVSALTSAASQGQTAFFNAASNLGQTLFLSQEYANRGRTDHQFVEDLYVAFAGREPEAAGWAAWEAGVPSQGRPANVYGFSSSGNPEWVSRSNSQYAAALAAQAQGGGGVNWLVSDQLGTPRMVADQSGSLSGIRRHDYLPFGEEIGDGIGGRTTGQGYTGNGNLRQKFTGKERDSETSLDFFAARYYSSPQGRFTSVDPLLASGDIENPQTWNRYNYALNNPLMFTDPTGMYVFDRKVGEEQRTVFRAAMTRAQEALGKLKEGSKEYNKIKRALDTYGKEGVDNGVTIMAAKFKDDDNRGAITQIAGVVGDKTKDNPTGRQSRVTLNTSVFNKDADVTAIALATLHEGSHLADGEDWVKSGFSGSKNPTEYKTEMDAYTVQGMAAQALDYQMSFRGRVPLPGYAGGLPTNYYIWNSGWATADAATIESRRSAAIDGFLKTPREYGGYGYAGNRGEQPAFVKGSKFR
ncbi:MAG TPA: RHS repeat-associated core domain-containing protein [Pyrinomonadaceae bacterium]